MDNARPATVHGARKTPSHDGGDGGIDEGVLLELKCRAIAAKGAAYCMYCSYLLEGERVGRGREEGGRRRGGEGRGKRRANGGKGEGLCEWLIYYVDRKE